MSEPPPQVIQQIPTRGRHRVLRESHLPNRRFSLFVWHFSNNLNDAENNHGTNYGVMLQHTDRLVVWGYFGDYGYPPEKSGDLARYLMQYGLDRIILSIGLWGPSGSTVSAADFKTAILASQEGGMPNLWICPGSMMSANHRQVLTDLWGQPK